eukprot:CAMPEP_0202462318 /NCGR_PEP_ID=MMETSP1360-20130828/53502_1 /ASSEMBLY_ACC=CAM_ASM_000848 /TAXON_ID=515479 /ORGANISM="Licmophora paradoxa, Strain CCMP2313" /LENGTH=286 /DNA_ID=CAMNT_0049084739 /DNA_START=186 /DNA_END=1046 /DNA_ORIENTATION=+
MSANKLMKRIIKPDSLNNKVKEGESKKNQRKIVAEDLHNSTFGISSDPLTQFAVVFSALIHDVDHYGVPNTQLVKEKTEWSAIFGNQSVAEQNSVVVAWDLLMEPKFADLQVYIFANDEGQHRFRQLLVNTVMATDIMDSDLVTMRKNKWERAFATAEDTQAQSDSVIGEDINRKATIVIEHIIQASDVAHTMQHWHIYTKWNEKLYQEMREAYKNERSEKDPAEKWYENELAFFDFYIIPLARKLQECGVFGVSSDEYLGFALENRNEWEMKGRQVTEAMVAKYQ